MLISKIWNESIDQKEEKPVTPRNRIWASELGKSDLDIYLKMVGEEVTNPFDSRAKRKFEAGNLFEWIVKLILIRCGVYQESQKWIGKQLDDCVEVSGKLDHLVGGLADYDKAKREIEALALPELFTRASENIINYFKETYPFGIPQQGIEVKSTSSFGIEKVYFTGKALAGHDLQAFHYAYSTSIPFSIVYICRDDLRMAEIPIDPKDEELFERYEKKIKDVSKAYFAKKEPNKEKEIVFEEEVCKFSKNFNVEYSSYLKRNYGFDSQGEFDDKFGNIVESWNRVLTRIKEGKELTDNNKEKVEEIKKMGFDFESIKEKINENKQRASIEGGDTSEIEIGE